MAIYRGPGGAGDATTDSSTEAAAALAAAAAALVSQNAAAASATAAATSASSAATSAGHASADAGDAASSAAQALISENAAETAQLAAEAAQAAAELAEINAETAKANAETAEANANASAALSQEWATKTSGPVAGGEYSSKYNAQLAATSAINAANSATSASASADAASTSANSASSSASAASSSSVNAANSAATAAGSATSAASSASTATTQSSNAANSATAAATSASSASTSATNAAASATSSSNSASTATTQATNASSSASAASESATNAANSAAASATSATNASNSASAALISKNLAEDWATKTTGTVDGIEYSSKYYAEQAAASAVGSLQVTNNLSDLDSVVTARTNLGLGTAAITDSTTYATAAQGTKADTAYGWGNHASAGYAHSGANTDITSMSSVTGGISSPDYIQFDTAPSTTPTTAGALYWDSADGNQTLSLVMAGGTATQQIGEEQYYRVKASSAITNGQVVMFTGTVGASGALTGAPATGLTASTASYVMGIATQDIALNDWGYVTGFGLVRSIDTSAFTDGAILYLDPTVAGGLTATIPTAPTPKVQVCACVHAASNGSLFVRPSYGGILGQYEGDVNISSPSNGQVLKYNGTTWVNTAETDPVYTASSWYSTTNNSTDWNTAYGWGNHASAGYLSGTVSPSNGGTGATTLTANNVILGNGTSAVQFVAPGASGNVLTSNGTTWTSSASAAGGFPSGTIMLFRQTSAPTGWTKDTTNYNDSAMRVVTGSVSSGGSVGFTTAFASQAVSGSVSISGGSVSAYTLTTTEMPSHTHTYNYRNTTWSGASGTANTQIWSGGPVAANSGSAGGGSSHTHGFTNPSGSFTGTAINLAVKYCDVIFATKD